MQQNTAGILVYRQKEQSIEVLLVHLGGPYWARKDEGAWSIPKGLIEAGEDHAQAAAREFQEETGFECPKAEMIDLGVLKMKSGKLLHAWATKGDLDVPQLKSNSFSMEWPPNSGRQQEFPEVDRGEYFTPEAAKGKIHEGQRPLIDRLLERLGLEEDKSAC